MLARLLRLAAAISIVYAASDATDGVSIDQQGVLKLYGNSFGRPGYNETFDYIVS
jgi:choline dehydrogenase